jgi:hypothetical protein
VKQTPTKPRSQNLNPKPTKVKTPQNIRIASILCWIWGVLLSLIGLAIGLPAIILSGNIAIVLIFSLWGGAYCVAGFALPRRKWSVGWWSIGLCVLSTLLLLLLQVKVSLFGILLNLAIGAIVVSSWKWLQQNR